jgi:putative sigma-54 modulation protein
VTAWGDGPPRFRKERFVQISISGRNGSLSAEMSEYLREKLAKLNKIFERIESIAATVEFRPELTTVEVLVNAEHKHDLVASDQADNFHGAVDMAVHKMESQLRRYKERIQEHRRTPPMGGANLDV